MAIETGIYGAVPMFEIEIKVDSLEMEGTLGSGGAGALSGARAPRTCPDCGWSGYGNFCASCGEELEPYLPKVRQFFHELASEFLALDSKILRTLPALVRPGFLTKEYLAGRRRKYLLPWRLYTLIALLCLFEFTSLHTIESVEPSTPQPILQVTTTTAPSTARQVGTANDPEAVRNGRILSRYLLNAVPYAVLIGSVPLFALLLGILYRKKKRLYVEHLIFSFHFFAFATLLFGIALVANYIYVLIPEILLFLGYLYFALRNVYADRGAGLVMRFATSTCFYFVFIMVGVLLAAAVAYGIGIYSGAIHNGASFYFNTN